MSTASALERHIECPASAVLGPLVHEGGEPAERGTEIHQFVRSVCAGVARADALAAVTNDKWRKTCEGIDFAKLCAGVLKLRAEAAYRLDVETDAVTFLGLNIQRRYPRRSNAPIDAIVDGTNDFEGFRFDGMPIVVDVKTGWLHVTPCKDNPQLKFHARVQQLLHGADKVDARVAYIRDDGSSFLDGHVFTRYELDTFGDELLEMKARIRAAHALLAAGGKLEVYAGDWCRYCSAKIACPRYAGLARSILPEFTAIEGQLAAMTLDERARAWTLAEEARQLLDRIRSAIQDLARVQPIPLPDGKLLKQIDSTSSTFDKERAIEMLRASGANEDEIASLTTTSATTPVKVVNDPAVVRPRARARKRSAA